MTSNDGKVLNRRRFKPQTCFVVMPFAKEFDRVYKAIVAAVTGPGLHFSSCVRADDIHGGGHVMEAVLSGIEQSEVIVADVMPPVSRKNAWRRSAIRAMKAGAWLSHTWAGRCSLTLSETTRLISVFANRCNPGGAGRDRLAIDGRRVVAAAADI